jgi:predicted oxidoreductase
MPNNTAAPGLELSPIVAGLWRIVDWNLSVQERVRWIERALELGISSFDLADIYGMYRAEGLFGEALKAAPGLRDRMQLVTKCGIRMRAPEKPYRIGYYDTSAACVRRSSNHYATCIRSGWISC